MSGGDSENVLVHPLMPRTLLGTRGSPWGVGSAVPPAGSCGFRVYSESCLLPGLGPTSSGYILLCFLCQVSHPHLPEGQRHLTQMVPCLRAARSFDLCLFRGGLLLLFSPSARWSGGRGRVPGGEPEVFQTPHPRKCSYGFRVLTSFIGS